MRRGGGALPSGRAPTTLPARAAACFRLVRALRDDVGVPAEAGHCAWLAVARRRINCAVEGVLRDARGRRVEEEKVQLPHSPSTLARCVAFRAPSCSPRPARTSRRGAKAPAPTMVHLTVGAALQAEEPFDPPSDQCAVETGALCNVAGVELAMRSLAPLDPARAAAQRHDVHGVGGPGRRVRGRADGGEERARPARGVRARRRQAPVPARLERRLLRVRRRQAGSAKPRLERSRGARELAGDGARLRARLRPLGVAAASSAATTSASSCGASGSPSAASSRRRPSPASTPRG